MKKQKSLNIAWQHLQKLQRSQNDERYVHDDEAETVEATKEVHKRLWGMQALQISDVSVVWIQENLPKQHVTKVKHTISIHWSAMVA